MKLRNQAVAALLLLAAVGSAVMEVRFYLQKKRRMEDLVVQAVSPYIRGSFQVKKVTAGFFSVHLKSVSVFLPAQAFSLNVGDIEVGISPVKLLASRFSIPRSISRIVLDEPAIEFSLAQVSDFGAGGPAAGGTALNAGFVSRTLAVEYLRVRNGVIRVRTGGGASVVLGQQLDGRLWDTGEELRYDLAGRLGASRNNLFVAGAFSWASRFHHLSFRLNRAAVTQPVSLKNIVITSGALSGALEFAFPDTASIRTVESNGWVKIEGGTCLVGPIGRTFNSVDGCMSIVNSRCTLDSLTGRYAGMRLRAAGRWDLQDRDSLDRMEVAGRDLCFDSLGIPQQVSRGLAGNGWLKATILRPRGSDVRFSVSGGGVTWQGTPLLGFRGACVLGRRQLSIDSLVLNLQGGRLAGSGTISTRGAPVAYSFRYSGALDSLSRFVSGIGGALLFSGNLSGVGGEPNCSLSVAAERVRCAGVPLGAVTAAVCVRGDTVMVALRNHDHYSSVKGSAVMRGIFSGRPRARCTLAVVLKPQHPLLVTYAAPVLRPDSLKVNVVAAGWVDSLTASVGAAVHSRHARGGIKLKIGRSAGSDAAFVWHIDQSTLAVNGTGVPWSGAGRLHKDTLVVDSLALFNRIVASGNMVLSAPARLDAVCRYSCQLKECAALAGRSDIGFENGAAEGVVRCSGPLSSLETRAEVRIRGAALRGFDSLETDAVANAIGGQVTVLPFVIRKNRQIVLSLDTITNSPSVRFSGRFDDLDIGAVFGAQFPEELTIAGAISGSFCTSKQGFPVAFSLRSRQIAVNNWQFDSVVAAGALDSTGLTVASLRARDGGRTVMTGKGFLPMPLLQGRDLGDDTLALSVEARGDLIATLHRSLSDGIDGSGTGALRISVSGQPENWHLREASLVIPAGKLFLNPYIPGGLSDFSCSISIKDSSRVSTVMSGTIKKREVRLFSTHQIPAGYEPVVIGPFNLGVLQVETPQAGVDLHIPGFMEIGETGDLELSGRKPLRYFSIAGPVGHPTVCGLLTVRDAEITYPFLRKELDAHKRQPATADGSSEPSRPGTLSLVRWDLVVKPGDRKTVYFRDLSNRETRIMRVIQASLDQGTSALHVRGSEDEETFTITGALHSYHGQVFYGKTFDRNFEAHVEFVPLKKAKSPGYSNLPFLWGSAEAFSDTSRFDRIKLTALVQDPATGTLSERGRLTRGHFNVIFRLSSDFEELPGESEREFYRKEGLQFTTLGHAGKFVSDFGEQYLHRYFLQRFERRLAKSLGLDVINIETSIASNYFNRLYYRQSDNAAPQADYLALANMGVTVGRYLFSDNLLIKARGGLLPVDTTLTPQYSVGFEFQPTHYLFMDVDYGIYKSDMAIARNPQVNLQLRLPLTHLRNLLDF